MPNTNAYHDDIDYMAELYEQLANDLAPQIAADPSIAEQLRGSIAAMRATIGAPDPAASLPRDRGLGALTGVGPEAASGLPDTRIPVGVTAYDEGITSERIVAVADLYYVYQHERIGVFRVVRKLQELFRAGAIRLSGAEGAMALYQFDRREVLRYTTADRLSAYKRAFGYGAAPLARGARANTDFHGLFSQFVNQVTLFWRDKRISDVIRERAFDPSFGSIAIVRRAGLDLRNNLKWMSYGHLNVLRVEVMQLLEEAFHILESDDVRHLFGAENSWDVVEDVLSHHFNEKLSTSPRQRMAVTGREILRWLGQRHLLQDQRTQFETVLLDIAEQSEEWLTSAQSLGLAGRDRKPGSLPWQRRSPTQSRRVSPNGKAARTT